MLLLASAVVLLLILVNGLFAMSELAIVSARHARLQSRAERGDRGARAALRLAEHPTRFLSAVQVGITLIGILAGAYGQATIAAELDKHLEHWPAVARYSEVVSTGLVVVVLTYLSLILGELVPKRIALVFPERIAALVAQPLSWLARAMGPFVTLLTASTVGILRAFGVRDEQGDRITQDEVETVLAEGTSAGLIEPEEQLMIEEVMRLGDLPVRAAMTPRTHVYWLSIEESQDRLRAGIRACPYSRFVVTGPEGIAEPLGVVHKKDILHALLDHGTFDLAQLAVSPISILETTSVLRAMESFKATPLHMAFVVDELGSFEGVVTTADLLEMIAGDFPEAHDTDVESIRTREDGSLLVGGLVSHGDLSEALGVDFSELVPGNYHTVAGLLTHRLRRIPTEGETAEIGGFLFEVVDMDGPRIDKLIVSPLPPVPDEGDG